MRGGGGIGNFNYPDNRREGAQKLNETIGQIPQPVLITGICVLICVVLLLIVLFAWLRARGRFILVDCIVRNRAAIAEPWKEFRAEGNSFFLFSLLVVLVLIAVIVIAGLVLIVPFIPGAIRLNRVSHFGSAFRCSCLSRSALFSSGRLPLN